MTFRFHHCETELFQKRLSGASLWEQRFSIFEVWKQSVSIFRADVETKIFQSGMNLFQNALVTAALAQSRRDDERARVASASIIGR